MRAVVIGADEKLGLEIVKKLYNLEYDLVITGKNKRKLEKIKEEMNNVDIMCLDIASTYNCKKLFNFVTNVDTDLVINCTNSTYYGLFLSNSIDNDLDLIDLNITSMHAITKLFLKYFEDKNNGFILNIAPLKSYFPNPLMATYMASKSYVLKLTESINYELEVKDKNVIVSCYCDDNTSDNIEEIADCIVDGIINRKKYISLNKNLKRKYSFKNILSRRHNLKTMYQKNKIG